MWSVGTERPCVGRGGLEGRASAGSARAERVRSLGAISGSLSPFVLFIILTAHTLTAISRPVILVRRRASSVPREIRPKVGVGTRALARLSYYQIPTRTALAPSPRGSTSKNIIDPTAWCVFLANKLYKAGWSNPLSKFRPAASRTHRTVRGLLHYGRV
jgi:hypothetical protein